MRLRVFSAVSLLVLLAACGGGGGDGSPPSIEGTIPADVSIVRTSVPAGTDAGTSPAGIQPSETQPEAPPEEAASPETQPEAPPEEAASPETQPAAPSVETAAPDELTPADDDDDSIVWWPWVLGIVVLVGAAIAFASRRRPGSSWQTQTATMLDEVDQLTSHLTAMTLASVRAVAASDATKLAMMRAELGDLITSAPDGNKQMVLGRLTTPMAELHGAIDAVALSADPSTEPSGVPVTQLAAQLHTTAASVRADLSVRR